ncbi:MAG: MFS transporter [Lachnospiraceae bacterium]|uniref:MFS transporter n=1 Tax=Candidatus Merdisoma sp. JLR.KK006 TaxID=3112626 RepID=UPI002FF1C301|nr:MFS transporter [Lachnospiraceae bacterium]
MQEKTYLKWYNKVGYGSGDIAGNVVYAFLSSFVMIYLTNTVGLHPGVVGSLIAASKLFDGVTDIFFGAMIDKTKSRLGKARPWMLYGYVGCALTLAAIFAIPVDLGKTAQYAWFFIAYTLLNAVFYTANNIAYSALTALVTKNSKERVQMGSYRFIFAFGTSLLIQSVTIQAVAACGGGAGGWRTVAIIYALIGLAVNTISALSVKELSEEELREDAGKNKPEEKYGLATAAKLLASNKFYLMICAVYILQQIYTAMINMGIYYMTYVLKNENLYGVFSWAMNIPLIAALVFTPTLVARWKGMYKLNLRGYMLGTLGRALVVVAGYLGSVPLMLLFTGIAAFGQGPWQGDMNAVIASCSEYTYLRTGKRVDGTMYSCTSLGVKLGGGLGTAIAGWLLAASGFDKNLTVQPESCMQMLYFMYLWIPLIINLVITLVLSRMNVEGANAKLKEQLRGQEEDAYWIN